MENDIFWKTSTIKRLLFLQKEPAEPVNVLCSSALSLRSGSVSPPWARVAGAEVTAHTEREGKGRTILFMHFKANIFIACPCIVCLYQKKNSRPFFCIFWKQSQSFSNKVLRKEYFKAQAVPFFFQLGFFSVDHSIDGNIFVWLFRDAYCLLWQVLLWSTSLMANLQTHT